jgi:hypothetical protein
MWIALFPNSQLVIFPYEPSDPNTWTMELFISPSTRLLYVCVAVGATCLLVALIVVFFHCRDKKEDEHEKKPTEHMFAF